jgi:putative ABC transport system permease protein
MIKAVLASLLAQRSRLLYSVLSVVLSVAFLSGTLLISDTLNTSINRTLTTNVPAVTVAPKGSYSPGHSTWAAVPVQAEKLVKTDMFGKVLMIPGVQSAKGVIFNTNTYVLDQYGDVVGTIKLPGVGTIFFEGEAHGGQPGLTLVDGTAPANDGDVVVDPYTLYRSGHRIGDTIVVLTPTGRKEFTVSGTAVYGEQPSSTGISYVFFTSRAAQQIYLNNESSFHSLWLVLSEDADPEQVASMANEVLPPEYEAYTSAQVIAANYDFINLPLRIIRIALAVIAALGCALSAFVMHNTFSSLVSQRGREFSIYRAIGASRTQIRAMVILEAAIVGLTGSIVGLLLGFGVAYASTQLDDKIGIGLIPARLPNPENLVLITVASALVGVLIAILASWYPAAKITKFSPIEALSEPGVQSTPKLRILLDFLALATGIAALVLTVYGPKNDFTDGSYTPAFVAAGILLTLFGVLELAHWIAKPVTATLGGVFRVLFGGTGAIASINIARHDRRYMVSTSSVIVSLAIATTCGVIGQSAISSARYNAQYNSYGDFRIGAQGYGAISDNIAIQLRSIEGVQEVLELRNVTAMTEDGTTHTVWAYPVNGFNRIYAQELVSGTVMSRLDEAIISSSYAKEHNLGVDSRFQLRSAGDATAVELKVVGIFDNPLGVDLGDINVSLQTLEQLGNTDLDDSLTVYVSSGADYALVHDLIIELLHPMPTLSIETYAEHVAAEVSEVQYIVVVVFVLLGMSVVLAFFAIFSAVTLNVLQRYQELGLLRALGMNRAAIRKLVTLEAISSTVVGTVLGVACGIGFGAVIRYLLRDHGMALFEISVLQIVIFFAAAVVVGVFGAIIPARTAAKINMLRVVTVE